MRWNVNHETTRTRKVFLWFPLSDGKEKRWLEFATIEEEWTQQWDFEVGIGVCSYMGWSFSRFVNA